MNSKYQSEYQRCFGRDELACKTGASSGNLDDSISDSRTESQNQTPGVSDRYHLVHQHTDSGSLKQPTGNQQQIGSGPDVLYNYRPASGHPGQRELSKQSEYNSKFKPNEDYVYMEKEGNYPANDNFASVKEAEACATEFEERNRQACKNRARSENNTWFSGDKPTYSNNAWGDDGGNNANPPGFASTKRIADENRQERKDTAKLAEKNANIEGTEQHRSDNGNSTEENAGETAYEERNRQAVKNRAASDSGTWYAGNTFSSNPWGDEDGKNSMATGVSMNTRMTVGENMQQRLDSASIKPAGRSSQIQNWQN